MKKAIYKIENKINHKIYIGQAKDPKVRWRQHINGKNEKNCPIHRALKKYGLSNFVKVILCDYPTFNEMDQTERESVQLSDCYPDNNMSYNLKEGGILND